MYVADGVAVARCLREGPARSAASELEHSGGAVLGPGLPRITSGRDLWRRPRSVGAPCFATVRHGTDAYVRQVRPQTASPPQLRASRSFGAANDGRPLSEDGCERRGNRRPRRWAAEWPPAGPASRAPAFVGHGARERLTPDAFYPEFGCRCCLMSPSRDAPVLLGGDVEEAAAVRADFEAVQEFFNELGATVDYTRPRTTNRRLRCSGKRSGRIRSRDSASPRAQGSALVMTLDCGRLALPATTTTTTECLQRTDYAAHLWLRAIQGYARYGSDRCTLPRPGPGWFLRRNALR